MQIRPLAAKVVANGDGNKSTIGAARAVYVCCTATDLITNVTSGATMQTAAGQTFVLLKDPDDLIMSGATSTHFTKIGYPRG
tara:strand:+ start:7604 stop:7849 length:246 start_codon:yes stop_codon:yes gene_type:complete